MRGGGIFSFFCLIIKFAIPNLSMIYFCKSESFKLAFKIFLLIPHNFLNLCVCVVNSKRLFWSQQRLILKLTGTLEAFLHLCFTSNTFVYHIKIISKYFDNKCIIDISKAFENDIITTSMQYMYCACKHYAQIYTNLCTSTFFGLQ